MLKLKSKERNIWFTSDSHYGHKNITLGESSWNDASPDNCRDFKTTKEMSQHIVDNINKYVKEDDILFHLGDWSFGGWRNIWKFRKQIICKTIHLIGGNHDQHIDNNKEFGINAQELFSSYQRYLEISIDGHMITIMHFPIAVWSEQHRGSWNLHGHNHGNYKPKGKQLDVGVDNIFKLFGEYKPISFNEVRKVMENTKIDIVDGRKR